MTRKFSTKKFIAAIPGTGGIISAIASNMKCDWHTAKKYIEENEVIKIAWDDEKNHITDKARFNIIKAISDDKDIQLSKWWLQVMDDEFIEKQRTELTGKDGDPLPPAIINVYLPDNGRDNGN